MVPKIDFFVSYPEEGAREIDLRFEAFTVEMFHAESDKQKGLQTREKFAQFDVINTSKPKGKKARFDLLVFALPM